MNYLRKFLYFALQSINSVEDARVFGAFCRRPKCAKHEEAESKPLHNHRGRRPRRPTSEPRPQAGRTVPTPLTQPAGADVQEAEAGGASFSQLNLKRCEKERFSQLVENEPRVSRKYGCRFFLAYFYNLLILLTLQFLFCF